MPLMEFCAGSNDRCYRCNQLGDPKLRTCSRCRVARYCSPQCQSDDWKKHKPNCTDHKTTLKNHPDSSMEDTLKVFVKWLDLWRGALLAWGAFSADLGNRPADYLLNHSYLVEVERLPPNEAQKHSTRSKFKAVSGGMRTDLQMREEFDRLTDLSYRAQIHESFKRIPPEPSKLRIVIVCFPLYSHSGDILDNIFPAGKAASFANSLSPQSRLVSTALVRAWGEQFGDHVRTGNVTGHDHVLDNVIQGVEEAALHDLD
ncbi:hypothetical protein B0H14DRAFT_2983026 [Mycena olivaceomarginata]|nr:hypothetical protein B0H14DRAFT_2983026 [Mycena olivaceomarginata]